MSVRKLNVRTCDLDESLDRAGFRHSAASIAEQIGAEAAVYEAEVGHPIWPYHYHHAVEEWMYVVTGEPVLRDAGGERALTGGDLTCFPPGYAGAWERCETGQASTSSWRRPVSGPPQASSTRWLLPAGTLAVSAPGPAAGTTLAFL